MLLLVDEQQHHADFLFRILWRRSFGFNHISKDVDEVVLEKSIYGKVKSKNWWNTERGIAENKEPEIDAILQIETIH
jgi:hypothetical protein